jgi:hypothetical protein
MLPPGLIKASGENPTDRQMDDFTAVVLKVLL